MILVFGGAYQGKAEYVKDKFGLTDDDFCNCTEETEISFHHKVINALQLFILGAVERKEDPIQYITQHLDELKDKVIVCDDISCGVVPLGKDMRLYRDQTGKVMQILARNADEVYRVYCGLGEKIK